MAATALFASAAGNKQQLDTLCVTTTPQMHCSGCETRIKQNIRFVKGVRRIDTSVPKQTVTIVYDKSKSGYDDFSASFKKLGYAITPNKRQ